MKITVCDGSRKFSLRLPSALLFSKAVAWLAGRAGHRFVPEGLRDIPPESMEILFAELRRLRKQRGSFTLVEAESAEGEQVIISL